MRFRVLGPLQLWNGREWTGVGAAQQRVVLALLLCEANRVVPVERMIDELWHDDPPARAVNTVQAYVLRLRRALDDRAGKRLVTQRPGYRLLVAEGELDAQLFEQGLAAGQQALADGRPQEAAEGLRAALELWRGPALEDVPPAATLAAEIARLAQQRLSAIEAHGDALLELGRHQELVDALAEAVAEHPLRERLREQLMLALYRSGRRADALEVYRAGRRTIIDELGLEPGPDLRALEQAVLNDDPALRWTARSAQAAATPVPAQLPAASATFVGRREHLQVLDDTAAASSDGFATAPVLITAIAGTAGVGKTALAVWWAQRARRRFADGQLYIDLRGHAEGTPVRPIEALARFLHALGVPAEQIPSEVEPAAALYRTLVADKRMLVLLDNAGDADQVRPLLPGGPGCMAVITSRHRLSGLVAVQGARPLTVDVLTPDESLTLLRSMLGSARVEQEPAAAARLAELCGHLPLALRIAAANLGEHPQLRLAEHVAELQRGDRLGVLAVAGDAHAAVRRAFTLSYVALAPAAARLFRLVGTAPVPDVTPASAAALAGTDVAEATWVLETLANAHLLVVRSPGRYGLHDLLRLYARERSHDDDPAEARDAALQRLCDHYLRGADAGARQLYPERLRLEVPPASLPSLDFGDRDAALAWIDGEFHNIKALLRHAAAHGPRRPAWLIADTLRGYFWLRVGAVDWTAVAGAGLAAAEGEGDARAQSAAHLSLGDAARCQSRYEQAIAHYLQAAALAAEDGWVDGRAAALGNLGNTYWRVGRLHESAEQHTLALALDREIGRPAGQAASLSNLGVVYRELGRLCDAADYLAQALRIDAQLASRNPGAMDLTSLGEVHFALGELDAAHDELVEALALHRDLDDRDSEADTLRVLAAVFDAQGRHDAALDAARDALTLARETGNRRIEADTRNVLAGIHRRLGRWDEAATVHEQAVEIARATHERYPETAALIGLSGVQLALGRHERAQEHADRALALARGAGYRLLEGAALLAQAALRLAAGDAGAAGTLAREALEIQRASGHRLAEAAALELLADAAGAAGDDEGPWRRQAFEIYRASGAATALSPGVGPA